MASQRAVTDEAAQLLIESPGSPAHGRRPTFGGRSRTRAAGVAVAAVSFVALGTTCLALLLGLAFSHRDSSTEPVPGLGERQPAPQEEPDVFLGQTSEILGLAEGQKICSENTTRDPGFCRQYPSLEFAALISANLGGHGPHVDKPEGIFYKVIDERTGEELQLEVHADESYVPGMAKFDGCSGKLDEHRVEDCNHHYGVVNLKAGTVATLRFSVSSAEHPKKMHKFALTWYDIDQNLRSTNTERISVGNYKECHVSPDKKISIKQKDGRTNFMSATYGDGHNNPMSTEGLTEEQKKLSATVYYDEVESVEVVLQAGPGSEEVDAVPRFFTFIAKPSMPCDKSLLPRLQCGKDYTHVEGSGEFVKWYKNVMDPVQPGEVIAQLKSTHDGSLMDITATTGGFLTLRQDLLPQDIIEQRVEAQPIACLSTEKVTNLCADPNNCQVLPPIAVGNGQVEVPGGDGIFVSWNVSRNQRVNRGDVIAMKKDSVNGEPYPIKAPWDGIVTDKQDQLKPGDDIGVRVPNGPIAVITSSGKLSAAPGEAAVQIAGCPEETTYFVKFTKDVGDEVSMGEVVAICEDTDGNEIQEIAPMDGYIKSELLLSRGEALDVLSDDCIVAIIEKEKKLAPLSEIPPIVPVTVTDKDGTKFKRFIVGEGDDVQKGQPIAIVTRPSGEDELVLAPQDGTVHRLAGVGEGDDLGERMVPGDDTIATLLPHANAEAAKKPANIVLDPNYFPDGTKFKGWSAGVHPGGSVGKGDVVATVTLPDGKELEVKSPGTGKISSVANYNEGDDVKGVVDPDDPSFVAVEVPTDEPQEIDGPFSDLDGSKLREWKASVGDSVKKGDVVAVVTTADGKIKEVPAPASGMVSKLAPYQSGDTVDANSDFVKILVLPPEPGSEILPADIQSLPKGTKFKGYLVEEGEKVHRGEGLAEVTLPDGTKKIIPAARDGTFTELVPLNERDDLSSSLPIGDQSVGTVFSPPTGGEPSVSRRVPLMNLPPDTEFGDCAAKVGDKVKFGDPVATVKLKDGTQKTIRAPTSGTVTSDCKDLSSGEHLDDVRPGAAGVTVIRDSEGPTPTTTAEVDTSNFPPGTKFKAWKSSSGDHVNKGDPVAIVTLPDGFSKEVTAPASGVVTHAERLRSGDDLSALPQTNPNLVTIESPSSVKVVTPVDSNNFPPGTKLKEWKIGEGATVKAGDNIATVTFPDNTQLPILAPNDGIASGTSLLHPGDVINEKLPPHDDDLVKITTPASGSSRVPVNAGEVPPGSRFKGWLVGTGDVVKQGDPLARFSGPDFGEEIVTAPAGGVIARLGPIKDGDEVSKISEPIVDILDPPAGGSVLSPIGPFNLPDGTKLKKWHVAEGDDVAEGEPLAEVTLGDGTERLVKAGEDGKVTNLGHFKPGDSLSPADENLVTIVNEPETGTGTKVPSQSTTMSAIDGDELVTWHKKVDDTVKAGEKIATISRDGKTKDIRAPRDGKISWQAPLEDGDGVQDATSSPVVVVEDPKLKGKTDVQGAAAEVDDEVVTWVRHVGDNVKAGDPVVNVIRDGHEMPIRAGKAGRIIYKEDVDAGDKVDHGTSNPMFLIEPVIPPVEEAGTSTAVGDKFTRWEKQVGDIVKEGDVVAVLHRDHREVQVKAPQAGTISSQQELGFGDEVTEDTCSPLFKVESPNPVPEKVLGQSVVPGDKVKKWMKRKGDRVQEGEVVAVIDRDGHEIELKSPRNGTVVAQQTSQPDGTLGEGEHSPLFKVEAANPMGSTAEGQMAEPGDKFVRYRKEVGQDVKEGEVVAVVKRDGREVPILAPKDGTVATQVDVRPHELINAETGNPLFTVNDGLKSFPPSGIGQAAEPGDKVLHWEKEQGDKVTEGDLVVTVDRGGTEVGMHAPTDGHITFQQPLEAGQAIDENHNNPLFVVAPPDEVLPQGVAVSAMPGDRLIEWKKKTMDVVGKGEPVAIIERNGKRLSKDAPTAGHVSFEQPLEPGDRIDATNDAPLFLIDPRDPGLGALGTPVLAPDAEGLGFAFTRLKYFAVSPGQHVHTGDVLAVLELVPPGFGRRLAQTGVRDIQVLSPVGGCVREMADLNPGDKVEDKLASGGLMSIGLCDLPEVTWLYLLIFVSGSCLICCGTMCLKKRLTESYDKMKEAPVPEPDAPAPGHKPITFDFKDREGEIHQFIFKYRPLGIVFESSRKPVRVQRLKFNAYAEWAGVQEGWTIFRIMGRDVSQESREVVEQLVEETLREKKVWPLRLDFKRPIVDPRHPERKHYQKKPTSYYVTNQPIGIEFSAHKVPVIIRKVYPDSWAHEHEVQPEWKLTGIGNNPLKPKDDEEDLDQPKIDLELEEDTLDYNELMRKFRDAVSLLEAREDNFIRPPEGQTSDAREHNV